MGIDGTQKRNEVVEMNIVSFLQCFTKNIGGIDIVDVEMMKDFFWVAKQNEVSPEKDLQVSKGKRKRNTTFEDLFRDFEI